MNAFINDDEQVEMREENFSLSLQKPQCLGRGISVSSQETTVIISDNDSMHLEVRVKNEMCNYYMSFVFAQRLM